MLELQFFFRAFPVSRESLCFTITWFNIELQKLAVCSVFYVFCCGTNSQCNQFRKAVYVTAFRIIDMITSIKGKTQILKRNKISVKPRMKKQNTFKTAVNF